MAPRDDPRARTVAPPDDRRRSPHGTSSPRPAAEDRGWGSRRRSAWCPREPALALATGDPAPAARRAHPRWGLVFGGGHVVCRCASRRGGPAGWRPTASCRYGSRRRCGPPVHFAAYLGTVAAAGPGGVLGAALATVAIFLPGSLLVLAALPALAAIRRRPGLRSALDGVNAAVVGILGAALVHPVGTGGITSPLAAAVALAGGAMLAWPMPPSSWSSATPRDGRCRLSRCGTPHDTPHDGEGPDRARGFHAGPVHARRREHGNLAI